MGDKPRVMKTMFVSILAAFFISSAFAAEKASVVCRGSYEIESATHSLLLKIYNVDEAWEMDLKDSVADLTPTQWRVPLDNRFLLSRVEYYSYDPVRVRMLFNSVKFSEKGIAMIPSLNKDNPIHIKCDLNPK